MPGREAPHEAARRGKQPFSRLLSGRLPLPCGAHTGGRKRPYLKEDVIVLHGQRTVVDGAWERGRRRRIRAVVDVAGHIAKPCGGQEPALGAGTRPGPWLTEARQRRRPGSAPSDSAAAGLACGSEPQGPGAAPAAYMPGEPQRWALCILGTVPSWPHFTDAETEAEGGQGTCLRQGHLRAAYHKGRPTPAHLGGRFHAAHRVLTAGTQWPPGSKYQGAGSPRGVSADPGLERGGEGGDASAGPHPPCPRLPR